MDKNDVIMLCAVLGFIGALFLGGFVTSWHTAELRAAALQAGADPLAILATIK